MRLFKKTLNVRLLAILLGATLLGVAAIHGLHGFQVRRQAVFFLEQAREAREKGQFPQALNHFDQYLRLRPDDVEALEEFGLLEADVAKFEGSLQHAESARTFYMRAYLTLEKLLRLAPRRDEARRRLVEVAVTIGRFSDAMEHLEEHLVKKTPEDVELLEILTFCQMRIGGYQAANQTLQDTIKVAPDRFASYDARARLLREKLDDPAGADGVMKQMVDTHRESAPALVVRASYFYWRANKEASPEKQKALLERAEKDTEAALQLEADNIDALRLAVLHSLRTREFDKAREYASRGVELAPKAAGMYLLLAETERNAGQLDAAIAVAQQGLEQLPDHDDLLWTLANLSLNPRDFEQARKATRKLADLGASEARVKYLEGGIAFWKAFGAGSRGDWPKVQEKLEAALAVLASSPARSTQALATQTDYWLGECYGHLGQPDLQVEWYRRALEARPSWTRPRIGLAGVLAATGKTDEALEEYESLARDKNVQASVLIAYARLLVQRNLDPRSTDRDWKQVDQLLLRAEAGAPDSVDLAILSAESLRQQGRIDDAKTRLEAAGDEQPEDVRIWTARAALAEMEKAAEILDEAQRELGDRVPLRIARARHLVRQLQVEASEESKQALIDQLQQLASDVDRFSDTDKGLLWQRLMEAWGLVGQMEETKRFCRLISELQPENRKVRLTLLELVRRTAKEGAIQQALQDVGRIAAEIDKIEDSEPHWRYAEAVRLRLTAAQATHQDAARAALNEALEHLKVTEKSLSRWASVPLLAGEICDLLGQPNATLEYYEKAIQLGSRDLTVLKRTTQLLNRQKRYAEVDNILRLMEKVAEVRGAEFPMGLEQQQAESFLRAGESVQALEEARKIAADSDDFNDHFWLAQMLIAVAGPEPTKEPSEKDKEHLQEAEQSLRHAIKLAPEEYRPWAGLIQFLRGTGQIQEAEETLRGARRAVQDPLALARLYESIDKSDEAVKTYEAELAGTPDDPEKTFRLINAYVRTRKAELAEPLLRKVLSDEVKVKPSDVAQVRRLLAQILIKRGGHKNREEAAELIRENLDADAPSKLDKLDKRSLANVLGMAPEHGKRAEAIRLLEQLVESEATPADQFLLATLYSTTEGDWPQSRSRMIALLASHGDQPQFVASYVEALLGRKEISDAELWLRKLEKLSPGSLATRGLRARLFVERKQFEAAVAHLTDPLTEPGLESSQRERLLPVIALQLERLAHRAGENDQGDGAEKLAAKAEAFYREYVEKSPEEFLRLASFLARQKRPLEALELAEKVLARSGGSSRELLILADVHIALERFDEVEALYRKVLRNDPDDVIALNNLAVLLALEEKQLDEALEFIDRAIEVAGAGPTMLDSRATVYLARKELPQALANMKAALLDPPTPTRLFHLAQIKDRMNDEAGARQALRAAHELNSKADELDPLLHALERPVYKKLNEKLNSDG